MLGRELEDMDGGYRKIMEDGNEKEEEEEEEEVVVVLAKGWTKKLLRVRARCFFYTWTDSTRIRLYFIRK